MATAKVSHAPVVPDFNRCEPGSTNIAIATFPTAIKEESENVDEIATTVVDKFNKALSDGDTTAIVNLFLDDCYWRDHLACSWDYRTLKGKDNITDFLGAETKGLKKVTINRETPFRAPHYAALDGGDIKGIEFFVDFEAEKGTGRGNCRLIETSAGSWKIFSLFLTLQELKGFEANLGPNRPNGVDHGEHADRKNWVERRADEYNYENGREPTVLIVGAGQSGLTAAARLKVLGIDSLVIDKNPRIGDNWRNRYKSLVLHDPVWYDHMPLLPFPEFWPIFTPKDKLAEWFESYARALELNVWNSATIKSTSWDKASKKWTISIERKKADGNTESRTFHPHHVIQATGHSGKMNMPKIKGMDDFKGRRLCHSSRFPGADPNAKGKKAIVVGCCNSGHDLSHTFYENGYDVTMVQRSSTCVISSKAITEIGLKGLYSEGAPPVEDADIWLYGTPSSVLKAQQIRITDRQNEHDKTILDGLEQAGFKLDRGPDAAGLFMKYFQRGGGYYIDVGASQLIIDGKIKIKQGQEIDCVTETGLRFADGTEIEADEIIFATGYQNMRSEARSIFGDELADQVGDIWGFDEEGEMRTIWRPSGHPGFWFMGGNLALCRYYSRLVALQIQAREQGLVK